MDSEKTARPMANGPEIINEAIGPTIGIICRTTAIKKYTTNVPMAKPHFPFRDSLAICINTTFSFFIFFVY